MHTDICMGISRNFHWTFGKFVKIFNFPDLLTSQKKLNLIRPLRMHVGGKIEFFFVKPETCSSLNNFASSFGTFGEFSGFLAACLPHSRQTGEHAHLKMSIKTQRCAMQRTRQHSLTNSTRCPRPELRLFHETASRKIFSLANDSRAKVKAARINKVMYWTNDSFFLPSFYPSPSRWKVSGSTSGQDQEKTSVIDVCGRRVQRSWSLTKGS